MCVLQLQIAFFPEHFQLVYLVAEIHGTRLYTAAGCSNFLMVVVTLIQHCLKVPRSWRSVYSDLLTILYPQPAGPRVGKVSVP